MSSNVYTIVPWSNLKPPMQWFGLRHCPHSVKAPSPRSLLVNKANSIDKSNPEKSEIVHQVDFKTPTAKLIASWHTVVIIVTTVTNHHKKYLSTQLLHHVTSYIYIYIHDQAHCKFTPRTLTPKVMSLFRHSIWHQSDIKATLYDTKWTNQKRFSLHRFSSRLRCISRWRWLLECLAAPLDEVKAVLFLPEVWDSSNTQICKCKERIWFVVTWNNMNMKINTYVTYKVYSSHVWSIHVEHASS